MSSIEKLSIRGIRNFSPNRDEIIEFYHPLTVILGDNGSGKTTIIECLKIACTGTLPPGARSGQSFIHDPRIAGTNEVKANIRLRFRNRAGKVMVAQRSYQLTRQKTTTKYHALDGVISMTNEVGEKVSMSHKCGELDRHIPDLLGVSKAILESVVFCHQEDSNWPLQEGAVLKKRFDDIFESARYTKALEAILKLKKKRLGMAKDLKRDLDICQVHLNRVDEIQGKIEQAENRLIRVQEDGEVLEDKVEEAEETLREMEHLLKELRTQETTKQTLQGDMTQKEEMIQRIYESMEQMMSDSDEDLESLLTNYETIIQEHAQVCKQLQAQESQWLQEKQTAEDGYAKLCVAKGMMDAKMQAHDQLIQELVEMATSCGSKYHFHAQLISSQEQEIQLFISKFEQLVTTKKKALKEMESTQQTEADALNATLTDAKARLHHAKEEMKAKQRQLDTLMSKKQTIATRIQEFSTLVIPTPRDVMEADQLIEDSEKALREFKTRHDVLGLKEEMEKINKEMNDVNFELEKWDQTIKVLRMHERQQITLDAKRIDLNTKEHELEIKWKERKVEWKRFVDERIEKEEIGEIVERLEKMKMEHEHEYDEKKKQVLDAEQRVQENIASSKHIEKQLATLRSEKNELERNVVSEMKKWIEEIMPGEDVHHAEQVLEKAEQLYLQAKDKTLRCKNTITFLSIFKQKGMKDHCCPLCQRDMTIEEQEAFVQIVNEKTNDQKVQDKIKKAEGLEAQAYKKWKSMEALMPNWRKWIRLETLIPEKSVELDVLYTTQRTLQADAKEKKYAMESSQKQVQDVEKAKQAFEQLKESNEELKRARTRLVGEEERVRASIVEALGPNAPSLSDIQSTKDEKQVHVQELNRQAQRKQTELQRIQEMQQQLQNDLHKKKQEKLDLDQKRMDYEIVREEQEKIRQQETIIRQELADLVHIEPDLERDVRDKMNEIQRNRMEKTTEIHTLRQQVQQISEDYRIFKDKYHKVANEKDLQLDKEVEQLGEQLAQIKQKQILSSQALDELSPQIASARQNLDQQETFKRHIRDNLEYRKRKKELEGIRTEMEDLKQKMSSLPSIEDVHQRIRAAKVSVTSARDERATLRGRQQQLEEQIRDHKIALHAKELKHAEEKHRQNLIAYETTMMAVQDLEKYYKALDRSLLQYHSKKVEEMNTIIRQLWQMTYKGQDIDTIELVSGQDIDTGSTSKATKSYDYRVVMKKGGALVDMRGRCSAGQKVLASLVIRLALAETFCLNCGILALDEPTTNLDTENKFGLAQAITEYVVRSKTDIEVLTLIDCSILNARTDQQNFQLVCITHDAEFVSMLSRTQAMDGVRPEYFWKVSREDIGNNRCVSRIERKEWGDSI